MVGPDRSKGGPASEWSNIAFPSGWSLQGATFSWTEEPVHTRSAEAIFAALTDTAPVVLLKSRVPTFTLPCREYAAGDWRGHELKVAVTGEDYSVRITMVESLDATPPFAAATGDMIEAIRGLTERGTTMKHLSLSVWMQGLRRETAHARFAAALGLAAPEIGIADQRYLKKMRNLVDWDPDRFLDITFELATAGGDRDPTHRLELTSQAQTCFGSPSTNSEDWSILLGASLTTISSITLSEREASGLHLQAAGALIESAEKPTSMLIESRKDRTQRPNQSTTAAR